MDDGGVTGNNGAEKSKGAGSGVEAVAGGDVVLKEDGNTVEEAGGRTAVAVSDVGVGKGIGVELDDGVEGWVDGVDSVYIILDELAGVEAAIGEEGLDVCDGGFGIIDGGEVGSGGDCKD